LNNELLNRIPDHLREEVGSVFEKAHRLEIEVSLLKEQIRLMRHRAHGASADRVNDAQLALLQLEPSVSPEELEKEAALSEAEKAATPKPEASRQARVPVRAALPASLPRRERVIVCPEADCRCAQCGGETKVIGHDTSETLAMEPIKYYVEVIKREKRACPKCEEAGVKTAPLPERIVDKGIFSDRVIIDVTIKKYCDHQPLFRQVVGFKRDAQIDISRTTLCENVLRVGELAQALSRAMRANLLAGDYIQADETPVPVQSPKTKGRNHRAYIWQYSRPGGAVVFDFRMGREREGPAEFLKEFGGRLQTDGYAAYFKVGAPTLLLFACWAHARRKFTEALEANPKEARAAEIVRRIGELYAVEKQAREAGLSEKAREALRIEKSVPVLIGLRPMIEQAKAEALPKSALGRACQYTLDLWARLERYAQPGAGAVEIDNNWAENAMRPVVLGRKNWLHIGSEKAGPKIAAILSVVETCKRLGIDVREYLEDVLPKLGGWPVNRVAELTPMAWKAARARQTP